MPDHNPEVGQQFVDGRWVPKPRVAEKYEVSFVVNGGPYDVKRSDFTVPEGKTIVEVIAEAEAQPDRIVELLEYLIEHVKGTDEHPFQVQMNVRPLWQ
jgi:hypothetical protein